MDVELKNQAGRTSGPSEKSSQNVLLNETLINGKKYEGVGEVATNPINSKILKPEQLEAFRNEYPNVKICHCHGVFDILHAGHLAYFESAKKFGDMLIVTLTADKFVNKGPGRPHFNKMIRARMIAALEVVDFVAISEFPTAEQMIAIIKPDFYVKGPDYRDKSKDITGAIFREEKAVNAQGGKLVFTDDDTHSSSHLLNQFFNRWSEKQEDYLRLIKQIGGLSMIEEALDRVAQESVQIVGEPIIDNYVFCKPEAISSKSPSISSKFLYEENYAGGSLAIANHLADFVKETRLLTTHGGEDLFHSLIDKEIDSRVQFIGLELANIPTPKKTRFIAEDNSQRIFELTNIRFDQWEHHNPVEFSQMLQKHSRECGTTILADFGHGLFEGQALSDLTNVEGFLALNVQTNSSNLGYNPFKKHSRFDYLSIDLKEARVAYHDRWTSHVELARRIRQEFNGTMDFSMTLGRDGAFFFPREKSAELHAPAYVDSVIDATGAGDAYFALTSMLVKTGCPVEAVPFIGNVFAGLKTKIIGNKFPVKRAQLLKAINSILK